MLLGLVVEGKYDAAVYEALVQRIVPRIDLRVRQCHLMEINGICKDLAVVGVGKALIIRDLDKYQPDNLIAKVKRQVNVDGIQLGIAIAIHELESWLLCDVDAVNRVCEKRGRYCDKPIIMAPLPESPDRLLNPKEVLKNHLSKCGIGYTSSVAADIAKYADIAILERESPSFRKFKQILLDLIRE